MPRYTLEIEGKPVAVFDAPNPVRAAALVYSSTKTGLVLKDTMSGGIPLWHGNTWLSYRPARVQEEARWQATHRKLNEELGFHDDQGLAVWLVPIDGNDTGYFICKDEWGLW